MIPPPCPRCSGARDRTWYGIPWCRACEPITCHEGPPKPRPMPEPFASAVDLLDAYANAVDLATRLADRGAGVGSAMVDVLRLRGEIETAIDALPLDTMAEGVIWFDRAILAGHGVIDCAKWSAELMVMAGRAQDTGEEAER